MKFWLYASVFGVGLKGFWWLIGKRWPREVMPTVGSVSVGWVSDARYTRDGRDHM